MFLKFCIKIMIISWSFLFSVLKTKFHLYIKSEKIRYLENYMDISLKFN